LHTTRDKVNAGCCLVDKWHEVSVIDEGIKEGASAVIDVKPLTCTCLRVRSIRRTLLPCSTKAPERQTAVVVFPTPPLWFTTATVFTKSSLSTNRTILLNSSVRSY